MDTNSNLTNLLILSALSATAVSNSSGINSNQIPKYTAEYVTNNSHTWSYNSISDNVDLTSTEAKKINIIVDFSRELISKSENLDSEFSKIVSDNFFDLL